MKNGTLYAERLKKTFSKLRQGAGAVTPPDLDDPLRRLAIGILGSEASEEEAEKAVGRLLASAADWNEVRVSTAAELQRVVGDRIPNALDRCRQLLSALQSVYDRENRMSLERLKTLGRREARQYLEKLGGVGEFAIGSVVLWSLGGHAIPVNLRMHDALRKADLVNPEASRDEVQAFLERNISSTHAKTFCLLMRGFKGDERAPSGEKAPRRAARPAVKSAARKSKKATG